MKKLGLLCVVLALFISGCGKDKAASKKESAQKSNEKMVQAKSAIPVVEETEDFFDSNKVADFAFVDDEKFESTEEFAQADKGFADDFEFIDEEEQVATADVVDAEELERMSNESALTTASIDDLVESVDELQQEMMRDSLDSDDEGDSVVFKTVCFDINKNDIRADQKNIVDEDIKLTQQAVKEGKDVVVQGHCCQLGPDSYNLVLSQRRAEAIKKEMIRKGVDANHIKTVGCGNEMPVVWSDAKDKKQLVQELAPNRRAEILVN